MINIPRLLVIAILFIVASTYGLVGSFADAVSVPDPTMSCSATSTSKVPSGPSNNHSPILTTIKLVEETDLYDVMYDNRTIAAKISPQMVEVVDRRVSFPNDDVPKSWYKIRTWLGERWIQSNTAIPGDLKPREMNMMLTSEETLYDFRAGFLNSSGATISPQLVSVLAEWKGNYLIETWLGDKWIAPIHKVIKDIQKIDSIKPVASQTELFTLPDEGCSTHTFFVGQSAFVIEQSNEWLHIRTHYGDYWINPNLADFDIRDAEGYMDAKILDAEVEGDKTRFLIQARLTDKLKSWSRPLQLVPSFTLYDEQGHRLHANIAVGPIEFNKDDIKRLIVYAQGDLSQFKVATSQVYTVNNTPVADATRSWTGYSRFNLTIMDQKYPEVHVGDIQVTKAGNYSIVRGKISVDLPNLNEVSGVLTFYNDKDQSIGTALLKGAFGNSGPYGNTTYGFEAIGKGDFSSFRSVKLTVSVLNKSN